jgi:hypothetical protein
LRLLRQPVVFVRRQYFVFIQVTFIEKAYNCLSAAITTFRFAYLYKGITAWSVMLYLNLRP